jgi:hypothetical protein
MNAENNFHDIMTVVSHSSTTLPTTEVTAAPALCVKADNTACQRHPSACHPLLFWGGYFAQMGYFLCNY